MAEPHLIRAAPAAAILIESLRNVGYTLETALADIVDNSVAAGATSIKILAETGGPEPRLAVADDGWGMNADELLVAMRLGNRNPLDERADNDLGRFGLGLKTASFSQCRRLTVATRQAGGTCAARWDLDTVEAADDWLVEIPSAPAELPWMDELGDHGTLVIWEKLDRLLVGETHDTRERHLVKRLDEAATHLELVFHRFLTGERGLPRVAISINRRPLIPFDPFHANHAATIVGPLETIRIGRRNVTLQAFTLPHHKKVTAAEWDRYAGSAGYAKNQGFYVYRGRRLIIYGTWFGLLRQTELTKLARVRIDVPTGLDAEWKIDIKKASAQLPQQVRDRLRRLVGAIGATSKRVYTVRGRRLVTDSHLPVWQRIQDKNEIRYGINLDHPVIAAYQGRLPEDLRLEFQKVVEVIGSSIPIDALFADTGSQPAQVVGQSISPEALEHAVVTTFAHLLAAGISAALIAEMLEVTEPFRSHWDAARRFLPPALEEASQHE